MPVVRFSPITVKNPVFNERAAQDIRVTAEVFVARVLIPRLQRYPELVTGEEFGYKYKGYRRTGRLGKGWKPFFQDTGARFTFGAKNEVRSKSSHRLYGNYVMGVNQHGIFAEYNWKRAVDILVDSWRSAKVREQIQALLLKRGRIAVFRAIPDAREGDF